MPLIRILFGAFLLLHIQCASKNNQQSFQSPQTTAQPSNIPLDMQLKHISSDISESITATEEQPPIIYSNNRTETKNPKRPTSKKDPTPLTMPQRLLYAIQTNDIKSIEELIAEGMSIHEPLENGLAPLHLASILDKPEIVKFLIVNKVNLNAPSSDNLAALSYAAARNHLKVFQILMNAGADINIRHSLLTPLAIAVDYGHIDIVKAILASGKKVLLDYTVRIAIASSSANILEALLKHGAKVEAYDLETALRHQAQNTYYLERLITAIAEAKPGTKPQKIDLYHYALIEACKNNNKKAVKYLLDIGARVNKHSPMLSYNPALSPLHVAAMHADAEILARLLDAGADIEALGYYIKQTPLHSATDRENSAAVGVLIARGAKLNRKTEGQTAIHIAAAEGSTDIVQQLKNAGAKLTIKNKDKKTALDLATEGGHKEVISILTP